MLKEKSAFAIALRPANWVPGQKCTKVRLEHARLFAGKNIGTAREVKIEGERIKPTSIAELTPWPEFIIFSNFLDLYLL